MQVEISEDIIRLCCAIEGGITNLNEVLALGLGCHLLNPKLELQDLGDLIEITYKSKRDSQTWSHEFSEPYPQLAATQTSLLILNRESRFNVTRAGIVEPDDITER